MTGLIIKYLDREYKLEGTMISSLVLHRNEFILEGGRFVSSFQKIREGIEFEVEVVEFDKESEPLSQDSKLLDIDTEYSTMMEERDLEWEWEQKLKMFREIESILEEEGLLK